MTTPEIVLHVGPFTLTAASADDEPRICDAVVAEKLGYSRLREFRELLKSLQDSGELPGVSRRAVARAGKLRGNSQDEILVDEYWLTDREVVIATMSSRTTKAREFRAHIATVFLEARSRLRAMPASVPVVPELVNGPRMGDTPGGRRDVRALCEAAAHKMKVSLAKVQGDVRRCQNVASPYAVNPIMWALVVKLRLYDMIEGRIVLVASKPKLRLLRGGADVRQMALPNIRGE